MSHHHLTEYLIKFFIQCDAHLANVLRFVSVRLCVSLSVPSHVFVLFM